MERYSIIKSKNPREIVLLRGNGCKWRKCTFCDYHLDCSQDENENYKINSDVLKRVKGIFGRLEVINSGSFCDLDRKTIALILEICKRNNISVVHFESHFIHRKEINSLKELFNRENIKVIIKTGVETFDVEYRERVMKKGFGYATPKEIGEYAQEVCLLFGLNGQTEESMKNDIETGLKYFQRVCVNIMNENITVVKPDNSVIELFLNRIAPKYINSNRVDILINNTDFGVGSSDEIKGE